MAGLVPPIHELLKKKLKRLGGSNFLSRGSWMAGTSPAMTANEGSASNGGSLALYRKRNRAAALHRSGSASLTER